jgi:regulatory protein
MDRELLAGALAAISRKDRTEREIRDWLADKGADPTASEPIVQHLIEHLAIDDSRFAEEYAYGKRESSGWGDDRIREVLLDKGISREVIEQALRDDEISQAERAAEFLRSKGVIPGDDQERQRALGMLARRGYSAEDAYSAIRALRGSCAAP